jgi:hypothetical protein
MEKSNEDMYMTGAGSPGMSSMGSGALGGNTNRGLGPLAEDHHRKSIEKIKKHLRSKQTAGSQEDIYGNNSMQNSFNGLASKQTNRYFAPTAPKGLAEKVRRHQESLRNNK